MVFSRVKPSEAAKTLKQVGKDLHYLVDLFGSYKQVKKLHEYTLLERVLSEQCRVTGPAKDKKKSKIPKIFLLIVFKALLIRMLPMTDTKAMSTSLLPYLKRILGFIAQYLAFESKPLTFKPV